MKHSREKGSGFRVGLGHTVYKIIAQRLDGNSGAAQCLNATRTIKEPTSSPNWEIMSLFGLAIEAACCLDLAPNPKLNP